MGEVAADYGLILVIIFGFLVHYRYVVLNVVYDPQDI
jgi:hypothetical protein